jgi:DNA sulfur modification protein DndD
MRGSTSPPPDGDRNVILIGAPNGYGKTSIFEALTLGLFGRDGLPLVPRATLPTEGEAETKLNTSYSKFLADALHRRAIPEGRYSCAAELEFEDDGEPIILERRWHFAPNGQHKLYDDELLIAEGRARRPVGPPAATTDRGAWFRDLLAQTFLPPHLAAFFLFDGEQVQRFARRDMADRVRRGIQGLLGLTTLRSLAESLRRYAVARRGEVVTASDAKVRGVEAEIDRLIGEVEEARKRIEDADALLPRLTAEQAQLSVDVGAFGGRSVALVAELHRDEDRLRSAAEAAIDELAEMLAGDVAIALAGTGLRDITLARLRAEEMRETWEAGREQGRANLDRYLETLEGKLSAVAPPLTAPQSEGVIEVARATWDSLWHPPPEGCADTYLHGPLAGAARVQAIARLNAAGQRSAADVRELLRKWRESSEAAEAKKRERLALEPVAPEAEAKLKRLNALSEEIGGLKETKAEAERALRAAEGQLAAKRAEFARYTNAMGQGAEPLRRAQRAEDIAKMINELLIDAVPSQVGEVGAAMTRAWRAMAHKKGLVERIEITPDCDVRLLSRQNEDLRTIQLSSGEEQIFTQSLIHAIAEVSSRDFPFVVDTPLARLDVEHRLGVLRYFTERQGQVILLSTDTEVVGPYLDAIRHRILEAYRLDAQTQDSVTVTTVARGYFERI